MVQFALSCGRSSAYDGSCPMGVPALIQQGHRYIGLAHQEKKETYPVKHLTAGSRDPQKQPWESWPATVRYLVLRLAPSLMQALWWLVDRR